jgi:hypothetical protein
MQHNEVEAAVDAMPMQLLLTHQQQPSKRSQTHCLILQGSLLQLQALANIRRKQLLLTHQQ